jgi:ligand-binding sensor domain-containing protein
VLYRSSDGYLWIGTYEGLARFDGVRFTVFDAENTPQLRSSAVWSVLEDRAGQIWVGTVGGGLARIVNGSFQVVEELSSESIHSLAEDSKGALWIGTEDRLFRSKDGRIEEVPASGRPVAMRVMVADGDRIWIGTRGAGLLRAEASSGLTEHVDEVDLLSISAIEPDGEGGVWIGSVEGGLQHLREGLVTSFGHESGLPHDRVQSLHVDSLGNVWVGTFGSGV